MLPSGNLAQRVITASVLAPLVILGILALPTQYFALGLAMVALLGAWEWAGLAGWGSGRERFLYCLATAVLLYATSWASALSPYEWSPLLVLALGWWCLALVWVVGFERGSLIDWLERPTLRALVGWLILLPFWGALVAVHGRPETGPMLIILLMILIWVADSGAYFVGKRFGKRRLSPRTSPGKSWEGVMGGLLGVGLLSAGLGIYRQFSLEQVLILVALSAGTVLLSILGDVTESLFKRRIGVKDSGHLLPGHGGILDRIDSLTAAAPLFALAIQSGYIVPFS